MKFSLQLFTRQQMFVVALFLALAVCFATIDPVMAGTDATFKPISDRIGAWLTGSLGYVIAIIAFMIGVVNAIRGERGIWSMAFPFFLSIIIGVGLTVIQGGFTAVI
ncbi:MAG: hypothetical protein HC843_04465 [Sphingomonadales bacterium]|nr:hypothetical protein [Sphingomonadales bacterium]